VAAPEPLSWRFDELAHAGREHLDHEYAARFDAKSPTDWSDTIEQLLALGIDARSTVVDLGAGSGSFALALAARVARVVAVDVSPAMVALLEARGLEAVQAGFLGYAHEGPQPDAVHTRNALHHLPDFWKAVALRRVAELLRPGGVLLLADIVYSFELDPVEETIEAWLAAAADDPLRGWTAAELAEHVRTEHSTFTWLLEPMLDRAGFDIRASWTSASGIYASYACVRR
jgi:SAM-dependent methyltransferase